MNSIKNIKPGTVFNSGGFNYKMVRDTGRTQTNRCRNQWGRPDGGTYTGHVMVVRPQRTRVGTGEKYWGPAKYVAYPEFGFYTVKG